MEITNTQKLLWKTTISGSSISKIIQKGNPSYYRKLVEMKLWIGNQTWNQPDYFLYNTPDTSFNSLAIQRGNKIEKLVIDEIETQYQGLNQSILPTHYEYPPLRLSANIDYGFINDDYMTIEKAKPNYTIFEIKSTKINNFDDLIGLDLMNLKSSEPIYSVRISESDLGQEYFNEWLAKQSAYLQNGFYQLLFYAYVLWMENTGDLDNNIRDNNYHLLIKSDLNEPTYSIEFELSYEILEFFQIPQSIKRFNKEINDIKITSEYWKEVGEICELKEKIKFEKEKLCNPKIREMEKKVEAKIINIFDENTIYLGNENLQYIYHRKSKCLRQPKFINYKNIIVKSIVK